MGNSDGNGKLLVTAQRPCGFALSVLSALFVAVPVAWVNWRPVGSPVQLL